MRRHIYWQKLHYLVAAAVVSVSSTLAAAGTVFAAPGDSAATPIVVSSCSQLQDVAYDSYDKHIALGQDIDCSDTVNWNDSTGFTPIGRDYDHQFTGTFDGRGHTISGLYVSRADVENVGLFGRTNGATIKNVNLLNPLIYGRDFVGGIVGLAEDTTIQRVSVVAGEMMGQIQATGYDDEGTAIAGVGGIVGVFGGASELSDAYSRISVASFYEGFARYGGGIVGLTLGAGGTISRVYSASMLNGAFVADTAGPLVGSLYYDTELTASFWDSTVYGSSEGVDTSGNDGNGRTTSWLKTQSNLVAADWDFDGRWALSPGTNDGYPYIGTYDDDEDAGATADIDNDKNGDHVVDASQSHVASLTSPVSGKTVAVALSGACALDGVAIKSEAANAVQDAVYEYPQGMVDFTATCGTNGFTTQVTLYYYDIAPGALTLRKYNPTTKQYAPIPDASISTQTIYGQPVVVASYQVTDGGPLDADGVANGTIVDPAGLAAPVATSPVAAGVSTPGAPNTGAEKTAQVSHAVASAAIPFAAALAVVMVGVVAVRRIRR